MGKKSKTRQRAVQIEIRESAVHGRGVYAAQFIPKGKRIIEFTPANGSHGKQPLTTAIIHTLSTSGWKTAL